PPRLGRAAEPRETPRPIGPVGDGEAERLPVPAVRHPDALRPLVLGELRQREGPVEQMIEQAETLEPRSRLALDALQLRQVFRPGKADADIRIAHGMHPSAAATLPIPEALRVAGGRPWGSTRAPDRAGRALEGARAT